MTTEDRLAALERANAETDRAFEIAAEAQQKHAAEWHALVARVTQLELGQKEAEHAIEQVAGLSATVSALETELRVLKEFLGIDPLLGKP